MLSILAHKNGPNYIDYHENCPWLPFTAVILMFNYNAGKNLYISDVCRRE